MKRNNLHHALDLRRADLDPERMACALAVQHIRRLIATGGTGAHLLDEDEALTPLHLDAFLVRPGETSHVTRRFEEDWHQVHQLIPQIQADWERGHALFQEDLVRATSDPEEMEYLSHNDVALASDAAIGAQKPLLTTRCSKPGSRTATCWRGGNISLQRMMCLSKAGLHERNHGSYGVIGRREFMLERVVPVIG